MTSLVHDLEALIERAEALGMLDDAARGRVADLLRQHRGKAALDALRSLLPRRPEPEASRNERDSLRPWTWTEPDYAHWLAGRRWIASRWAKAGGRVVVILLDPTARDEARAKHPGLAILTIADAECLVDAREADALSQVTLEALLESLARFGGSIDLNPLPAEPIQ